MNWGGEGSSSPTGIRILAQGCRPALRSSEARRREQATLRTPHSGYPNPNGVASVPESIPDVFPVPKFWITEEKKAVFRGIHRVDQDSRQGLRHDVFCGYSGSDATPLGLGNFWGRCPGVGFTALRQPRAEIRNSVGVGEFLVPLSRGRLHCVAPTPG